MQKHEATGELKNNSRYNVDAHTLASFDFVSCSSSPFFHAVA